MNDTAFFGRHRTTLAVLILLAPAVFGCSGSDRLKKQVSGLETQLTALRADQDRLEERLAAVELSSQVLSRAAPAAAAERVEHPRLKVIHLGPLGPEDDRDRPTEPAPSAAPESGARRPIIRGTGDRVIKVGDADSDETTRNDDQAVRPVAQLGRDSHGN